jgi:hypothetical protein
LSSLEDEDAATPLATEADVGARLDLLDVGDITLRVTAVEQAAIDIPLAPRAFPDIGDLASGVFYTSPDASRDLPAPGSYAMSGTGALALDAFVIEVSAPSAPQNVRVESARAGVGPSNGRVAHGDDLTLTWDRVLPHDGGAQRLVYIDVSGTSAYRCAFADEGAATLPGAIVDAEDIDGSVTVAIHRLEERLAPVQEQDGQLTAATVRFDLAHAIRVDIDQRVP